MAQIKVTKLPNKSLRLLLYHRLYKKSSVFLTILESRAINCKRSANGPQNTMRIYSEEVKSYFDPDTSCRGHF